MQKPVSQFKSLYERAKAEQAKAAEAAGGHINVSDEVHYPGGNLFNPTTGQWQPIDHGKKRGPEAQAKHDTRRYETKIFPSGNKYEGEWLKGVYDGKGKLTYADGRKYEGNWCEGVMHGQGCFNYANGDQYRGEYYANKQHGKGRFVWRNGDLYDGEWQNGQKHGKGCLTKVNGDGFKGYFTNGHPDMQILNNVHRHKRK